MFVFNLFIAALINTFHHGQIIGMIWIWMTELGKFLVILSQSIIEKPVFRVRFEIDGML